MATATPFDRQAVEPLPEPRRVLVPSGVLGMLLFVFTEAMLFAGLVSAHTIVRAGAQEWPPAGQPRLPVGETMLNTAALLASGVLMVFAQVAFKRGRAHAKAPLLLALLFGAFFVGFQGREWLALLSQGLTLTSSTYGSFFYVIIGCHALHATGALVAIAWAQRRLANDRLTAHQLATVATFWYFVVAVWPMIYWRVYW